jgi:two-component system, cell cycle response regulator DivK
LGLIDEPPRPKVLIIDDSQDMRELVKTTLEFLSYIVMCAKDGKEGLEKAELEKPDLILMDIMMPGMSGWEATRLLRTKPDTKDVPILAMTALSRQANVDACFEAGCSDYILKPFSFLDLRERIRQLLAEDCSAADKLRSGRQM